MITPKEIQTENARTRALDQLRAEFNDDLQVYLKAGHNLKIATDLLATKERERWAQLYQQEIAKENIIASKEIKDISYD
jgi:hypothetical protein